MKRFVAIIMVLLLNVAVLGGCSNKSVEEQKVSGDSKEVVENKDDEKVEEPEKKETVTIKFENHGANKNELFAEAVEIFNNAQDEVFVDFQTNSGDWAASLWAGLATGTAPDIVTHLIGTDIEKYVEAGHLYDISDMDAAAFIKESALDAVTYKGGVYAIPLQTEIYGIFYNKSLFEKAGITEVPKTITELEEAVVKLEALEGVSAFGAPYRAGVMLSMYLSYGSGSVFMPETPEAYAGVVADMAEGRWTFDTPEFRDVMRTVDLIKDNCQEKAADTDYPTYLALFAKEEIAMMPQGNWCISQLRELNPGIDAGIMPFIISEDPEVSKYTSGYNLVLNVMSSSENIEAVDKFLTYFLDIEQPTKVFFEKNALPEGIIGVDEAIEMDSIIIEPLAEIEKGNSTGILSQMFPSGYINAVFQPRIQEYMVSGDVTIDELIELLDKDYQDFASKLN